MIVLLPPLLREGWSGHPLCLSGDSSELMDHHWAGDCAALLLFFFLRFSSILLHCSPTQFSVAFEVPELPNNQPNQSPKQSHAEDHAEQPEATSGEDHR